MTIIPLSEGAFTVDKTKVFTPFVKGKDDLQSRPLGSLLVEVQPFVVKTKEDIVLIDAGLGFCTNGQMQIHETLIANNINPNSITKVLMSHLHKDHAGAIQLPPQLNQPLSLSFPKAQYFVNLDEFQFANSGASPSYITEEFELLATASNVTFTKDNGKINDTISYEVTGAHCPYHQVFKFEEDGEIIFYGGDVAPQLQQMKNRFIAKYDYDGKKCMELRTQWWEQGKKENWTFLFYHDIKTPFIKL